MHPLVTPVCDQRVIGCKNNPCSPNTSKDSVTTQPTLGMSIIIFSN